MRKIHSFFFIFLLSFGYGHLHSVDLREITLESKAILQGQIQIVPVSASHENSSHIQPGSIMKFSTKLTNIGTAPNTPGKIFLRFTYPKPLENQQYSTLFETESLNLPSIPPGKEITLNFSEKHKWPSLFDFIRHDWGMRQYQAIVIINDVERIVGRQTISFSAYYYEGPSRVMPAEVPAKK